MSAARADRVLAAIAERELDALLVTELVNVRWLTGFTGSNGLAVIGPDARRFLTDFRYLTQADAEVDAAWGHEIATDLLERAVKDLPARVGFDDQGMSVRQFARLEKLAGEGVEGYRTALNRIREELKL